VTARRRRGLLLVSVALASGGLAASQVHDRERRAAEQLGPGVDVLVAARDLPAGSRLGRGAVARRSVPARYVPPDALGPGAAVSGARVSVPVASGSYLTAGLFEGDAADASETGVGRGERAVTVEVAAAANVGGLTLNNRVDVLVSTENGAGGGRTVMAFAAELLSVEAGGQAEPGAGPTALATLRVSVQQAIYLTAADNFAREIRLLARPPGDHSRVGGEVAHGQL
jgi:pilus assembly protein CpaB